MCNTWRSTELLSGGGQPHKMSWNEVWHRLPTSSSERQLLALCVDPLTREDLESTPTTRDTLLPARICKKCHVGSRGLDGGTVVWRFGNIICDNVPPPTLWKIMETLSFTSFNLFPRSMPPGPESAAGLVGSMKVQKGDATKLVVVLLSVGDDRVISHF